MAAKVCGWHLTNDTLVAPKIPMSRGSPRHLTSASFRHRRRATIRAAFREAALLAEDGRAPTSRGVIIFINIHYENAIVINTQAENRRAAARDLLAPVYGWFTEGFATPDLKEAKALLETLDA